MFVSSQDEIDVSIPDMLPEEDCSTKGAFCKLKNTLIDFQNSIVQEMTTSKERRKGEIEWCTKTIGEQTRTVAERKEKVDDLTEHLDWLRNEKKERENDRDHKAAKIESNLAMLKDFKKKRCDSNLIFVKNLREHMDAIQIMKLLKDDIKEYFRNRAAEAAKAEEPIAKAKENIDLVEGGGANSDFSTATIFIEKLMVYSHLFNEEHKQVLLQLKQHVEKILSTEENKIDLKEGEQTQSNVEAGEAMDIKSRTDEEIGTGHVDNKRGVLKALKHPPHEKYAQWVIETEKKVLSWIDKLVEHLKDSKEKLTEYEIKAATDFAIWQRNMLAENERLKQRIAELVKEIAEFAERIKVAEAQLVRRKELLQQAIDLLEKTKNHCDDMRDFYAKNVERRQGEFDTAIAANQIYDDVMKKFEGSRIFSRVNTHQETGEEFGNELEANVVPSENPHAEALAAKQEARNEVVFY